MHLCYIDEKEDDVFVLPGYGYYGVYGVRICSVSEAKEADLRGIHFFYSEALKTSEWWRSKDLTGITVH